MNRVLDIAEFEESFIRPLEEARAGAMLQQGMVNQLVHLSPDARQVRTLNLQRYVMNTIQTSVPID